MEVSEHQAQIKPCSHCGHLNKATLPEQVKAPVQYGPRLKAIAVYLRQYQLLPYNRIRELLGDLFSTDLSEGTLTNITETCSEFLQEPLEQIRKQLKQAPVVNFDETKFIPNADLMPWITSQYFLISVDGPFTISGNPISNTIATMAFAMPTICVN